MGNVVQLSALWEAYHPEKRTWWVFQEMSPQVCWGMHCLPGSVSPITIPGDRSNDWLVVWKHSIPRSVNSLNKLTCHVVVEGSWGSDCLSNPCRVPPFLISRYLTMHAKRTLSIVHFRGYVCYQVFCSIFHAFSVIYCSKECSGCLLCEASHVWLWRLLVNRLVWYPNQVCPKYASDTRTWGQGCNAESIHWSTSLACLFIICTMPPHPQALPHSCVIFWRQPRMLQEVINRTSPSDCFQSPF